MEIIHRLKTELDICMNVTAMMSAKQCLLATIGGATYVSMFAGRVANMGYNPCDEINHRRIHP